MNTTASYIIGADIGATQIKAVAVAADGALLQSHHAPTDDAGDGWKRAVPALVEKIESGLGPAAAVGISSPGLARADHSAIAWMRGRLADIQDYVWADAFSRRWPTPVLNDAHAALLGECWIGAARGQNDVVLFTLGTGVGGAILAGGRLLEGRLGRAGHLGHISLDPDGAPDIVNTPGSLEDCIGEHSLPRRSNGKFQTTRQLIDAALAGDETANSIWKKSIRALAAGMVSVINVIDPALIVVGGGIANSGDALLVPLRRELEAMEWRPTAQPVPIVPAKLGEWAGAYGAARFAMTA